MSYFETEGARKTQISLTSYAKVSSHSLKKGKNKEASSSTLASHAKRAGKQHLKHLDFSEIVQCCTKIQAHSSST